SSLRSFLFLLRGGNFLSIIGEAQDFVHLPRGRKREFKEKAGRFPLGPLEEEVERKSNPTVWVTVTAISVETPREVLRAARGRSVTLPCTYRTSVAERKGFIQWDKLLWSHSERVLVWTFSTKEYTYGDLYENRVNLSGNAEQSDASITISQLTMDDNGTYECSVSLLKDLGGTSKARVRLLVLVPPSKPDCSILGETVIGNDIQLTCQSREGSPAPQYHWRSFDLLNQERRGPPGAGHTLTLKNISTDMSGYYICTSSNEVGTESCNITLTPTAWRPVQLPGFFGSSAQDAAGLGQSAALSLAASMNVALYAGIAGGVVAALIIIGVLVYCCCCREKGEDQEPRPNRSIYREPPEQLRELPRGREEEDDSRRQSPDHAAHVAGRDSGSFRPPPAPAAFLTRPPPPPSTDVPPPHVSQRPWLSLMSRCHLPSDPPTARSRLPGTRPQPPPSSSRWDSSCRSRRQHRAAPGGGSQAYIFRVHPMFQAPIIYPASMYTPCSRLYPASVYTPCSRPPIIYPASVYTPCSRPPIIYPAYVYTPASGPPIIYPAYVYTPASGPPIIYPAYLYTQCSGPPLFIQLTCTPQPQGPPLFIQLTCTPSAPGPPLFIQLTCTSWPQGPGLAASSPSSLIIRRFPAPQTLPRGPPPAPTPPARLPTRCPSLPVSIPAVPRLPRTPDSIACPSVPPHPGPRTGLSLRGLCAQQGLGSALLASRPFPSLLSLTGLWTQRGLAPSPLSLGELR
ncbi:LOW QUALITY PROTEIN: hypothetical protein QTO34_011694, partial [Cnephaeus nilssonii]